MTALSKTILSTANSRRRSSSDLPPQNWSRENEKTLIGLRARKGTSQCLRNVTQWIQVVAKLRKADVELGKGKKVPEVCKLLEIVS